MAAAALPLALSPLGGGEGGGDTNNTPPSPLQKKKKRRAQSGGPRRPRPCTCAPGCLARAGWRCKLYTFFVPSAPPPPSRGCTSPLPYLYTPPPPAAPLPPLPAPPPHSPDPPMLEQREPPSGPRLRTPPAGPGAAVSAPPDQCKRSAEPANHLPLPLPCPLRVAASRVGGQELRGADPGPPACEAHSQVERASSTLRSPAFMREIPRSRLRPPPCFRHQRGPGVLAGDRPNLRSCFCTRYIDRSDGLRARKSWRDEASVQLLPQTTARRALSPGSVKSPAPRGDNMRAMDGAGTPGSPSNPQGSGGAGGVGDTLRPLLARSIPSACSPVRRRVLW
ncbi:proline-rich protein 12-like [Gorilla gorilla gorilla]|uniref:proline-rich protein 12-like n=1 Tax=Gorilla gorilla gorilla TaxID=9595 RepID=UPI002446134B|nr:proline-rich protein 12-like [Gorilla gorilla gorilla]